MTDARKPQRPSPWGIDFPLSPRRCPIFYGWVLVVGSALGILGSMPGQTIGFSVFTEILMEELSLSRDQISLSYMVGTLMSGFLLPFGGSFLDRHGIRKTMVLASLGLGFVCLYFSFIDLILGQAERHLKFLPPAMLGWGTACLGFFCIRFTGQGMMSMSSTTMLGKWFHYRRGIVQSIRGLVISIGFSLTPLGLHALLGSVGWRASYWVLALVCGFSVALLAYVFFRDNPEECGLMMDGGYQPKQDKPTHEDLVIYRDFERREALATFSFWVYTLAFCIHSFVVTGFAFHVVSIGESIGLKSEQILAVFVPVTLISIPTNFLFGWLSDRTRLRYLLVGMTCAQAILGLSFLVLPSFWGKVMLIGGLGVSGGSFAALTGVVYPRYFGRAHLGAISGFFLSSTVISSALGPILFSRLYTQTGSYLTPFLLTTCLAVILLIGSFFAVNPQRRLARQPGTSGSQERDE